MSESSKKNSTTEQRRDAREFALQFFFHLQLPIYQQELESLKKLPSSDELIELMLQFKEATGRTLSDEGNGMVLRIVSGTLKNYQNLLDLIDKNLNNWKLERIPKVDLSILLLASFELLHHAKTPKAVIINEAVELAKKFGTKESPNFINGILETISK